MRELSIDKAVSYESYGFTYKNFCILSKQELLTILEWRNHPSIRKLMTDNNTISVESHLAYTESLKNRSDRYYWLVLYKQTPIGVMNISSIDHKDNSCEPGYYLSPMMLDSGIGLDFHYSYKNLIFNIFNFDIIRGYILKGNDIAYLMSLFFGAFATGIKSDGERKFVTISILKEDSNKISSERLSVQFAKFIRSHGLIKWDEIIKQFTNNE